MARCAPAVFAQKKTMGKKNPSKKQSLRPEQADEWNQWPGGGLPCRGGRFDEVLIKLMDGSYKFPWY